MVAVSSFTRFSSLKMEVILTQTDTTVGFVSQDEKALQEIKSRKSSKPFIKVFKDFATLKNSKIKIPQKYKNIIRRSKKTTFIIKNKAFRIVKKPLNSQVLKNLQWHYSTSANESNKNFNRTFCEKKADIIIEDKYGLRELSSSKLYKINKLKRKRIR